jgi:hypothetical protein
VSPAPDLPEPVAQGAAWLVLLVVGAVLRRLWDW